MEIREYRKATVCEHRGRLRRRCRAPLLGQCQYCARGFCAAHGGIQADGQEICVEERCQRRRVDVAQHLIFKEAARARNAAQRCGEPSCGQPPRRRCDRCLCRYCEGHLRQVIMTVTRGGEAQSEAAAICDHCRARLPLWTEE